MSTVFKVSYVVQGGDHPGAIVNEEERPTIGGMVRLGKTEFEIVEVVDLLPERGDFKFLHATVRPHSA
jgi:hypothetical protein